MGEGRVIPVGICHRCRHLDRSSEGAGMRCSAFPKGIPIEIRVGRVDHTKPVLGDRGIQFETLL